MEKMIPDERFGAVPSLSSAFLTDWRRKKLLSMYLRPHYIARTLWRSGSPRVTANYIRAGARRLRQLVAS